MHNREECEKFAHGIAAEIKDNRDSYFGLAFKAFFTDLLSLGICVANIYFMEWLTNFSLSAGFLEGYIFISQSEHQRNDGLVKVFPGFTTCILRPYGNSYCLKITKDVSLSIFQE